MAVSVNYPRAINPLTELLVFGYCRECEILLASNAISCIIPPLVMKLCALFYQIVEHFDIVGNQIKLSDDKNSIDGGTRRKWGNSSFGIASIPLDKSYDVIYRWHIRINDYHGNIAFGLTTDDEAYNLDKAFFHAKSHNKKNNFSNHYGYGDGGYKIHDGKWTKHETFQKTNKKYWIKIRIGVWSPGDIICIELNCKTKEITFLRNEIDFGTAFTNIKCGKNINYRLVVSLVTGKVTLEKFECTAC